jgi:pilus assembly protein Flp/PilA
MNRVVMMFKHNRSDETGASAVEYGMVVFAIAAVIVAILFLLGGVVEETYSDSCTTIAGKAAPSASCS